MKTPFDPSKTATARVKNPAPIPTSCPHCAAPVKLVNNSEIYNGKSYGEWPWAYLCTGCRAYVGLHPFTAIPLGTLATAAIRTARMRAKDAFNPLWQSGKVGRSEAYHWLARQMGIANPEECHIGWFDVEQCAAVVAVCNGRKTHSHPAPKNKLRTEGGAFTGPKVFVPLCDCNVLPWEDCAHTVSELDAEAYAHIKSI